MPCSLRLPARHGRLFDPDTWDFLEGRPYGDQLDRRHGPVRLLFVADEIPAELRRIVEFLSRQMVETEVLAVEVRQFVGRNLRTRVPRVIGRTEGAVAIKERRPGWQWDEASFLAALAERKGADVAAPGQRHRKSPSRL